MARDLKTLVDNRENILLAEIAAWLHDMGKCADAFFQPGGIGFSAQNCQGNPRVNPHKAVFSPQELQNLPYWFKLSPSRGQCSRLEEANHPTALWRTFRKIAFASQKLDVTVKLDPIGQIYLRELVLWGRPLVADRYKAFQTILSQRTHLAALLGQSHSKAHMEKEEKADGKQGQELETPFGHYKLLMDDLDSKLKQTLEIVTASQVPRRIKLHSLRSNFTLAPGDTRRPINEVTLWDWSSIVAALYKAEIARCVLAGAREPKQVAWRLLSIRTDGLKYMLSVSSIPDLLARKELLTDAWNRVRKVLEEEYPLGLEVYRDEDGPIFVVSDLENLLGLSNSADHNKTLREYILEAFRQGTVKKNLCLAIDGEVVPILKLDEKPWKGQPVPEELPPIGKHLEQRPSMQSDPITIAQAWCNCTDEVCTVCGLRPQGPGRKAKSRNMCDICEERRADRAKAWAEGISLISEERFKQGKPDTIWLDEVADANGRLALTVGRFDLKHWLSGTLVQSLAVRNPENVPDKTRTEEIAKNPSFARLRRIWETTRRFWQEVAPTDAPPKELVDFCKGNNLSLDELWEGPLSLEGSVAGKAISEKRARVFLKVQNTDELTKNLGPFHAYEIEVQKRKVAVLWVPPNATDTDNKDKLLKYHGGFWVIENLAYLDRVFGQEFRALLQSNKELPIYEPSEYARPGKPKARLRIEDVQEVRDSYIPLIPILAEPRTFMALVPADKALDVVRAIRTKYEREMGKVRNRLPLHLGVVFTDSHQPLRTIMDAGRRILRQKAIGDVSKWRVVEDVVPQSGALPTEVSELSSGTQHFDKWYTVKLEHETIKRTITWYVPALMGDGRTEDHWYPYVFLAQENEPKDRNCYFAAQNPWSKEHKWLVHAGELKKGDIIYFTSATFDFVWLGHPGTRFEIAYDEDGQRLGTLHRPYLLDELEELVQCWKMLSEGLSTRQIHQVRNLIEAKRAEWFKNPQDSIQNETFQKFCHSVMTNAEWKPGFKPDLKRLIHWAVIGLLADTVELFHHILKQRPMGDDGT